MKRMCWICWEDATFKGVYGDWEDLDCLLCGRYRISRRFVKDVFGRKFHVDQMHEILEQQRIGGDIPTISFRNAAMTAKPLRLKNHCWLPGWPAR